MSDSDLRKEVQTIKLNHPSVNPIKHIVAVEDDLHKGVGLTLPYAYLGDLHQRISISKITEV